MSIFQYLFSFSILHIESYTLVQMQYYQYQYDFWIYIRIIEMLSMSRPAKQGSIDSGDRKNQTGQVEGGQDKGQKLWLL